MARPELVNGEVYHIYNRGTEGRNIFLDEVDYLRFIHDIFEFNDEEVVPSIKYNFCKENKTLSSKLSGTERLIRRKRKLLIDLLIFCLMPNHFHLLVMQRKDKGISKFMQKLGTGYTNYFNTKYERKGVLFQGKFKIKLINREVYFDYIPHYIHANPLDLTSIEWREKKINDIKKALKFLEHYRWSSYFDYIGKKNFPSVTQRDFVLEIFKGTEGYKKSFCEWLNEMKSDTLDKFRKSDFLNILSPRLF